MSNTQHREEGVPDPEEETVAQDSQSTRNENTTTNNGIAHSDGLKDTQEEEKSNDKIKKKKKMRFYKRWVDNNNKNKVVTWRASGQPATAGYCVCIIHVFTHTCICTYRFTYQQLRGWRPILSARRAEVFFLTVGSLMLGLGIPILVAAINVQEYRVRYDNAGSLAGLTQEQREMMVTQGNGVTYDVPITVDKEMKGPVRVFFCLVYFTTNAT